MSELPAYLDAAPCSKLRAAYTRSTEVVTSFEGAFAARAARLAGVVTIAVGGSLGRLETSFDSDIDCIVVLESDLDEEAGRAAMAEVEQVLARGPFRFAKPDGIYRRPIGIGALLDRAGLGSLAESPEVFGKRMQVLLDARPIYRRAAFVQLQRSLLDWYATDYISARPSRGWTLLLNDLMRYLHAYAGWQQFKFERRADDSWQLRQAKLRGSRLLTFAGLLFLLGESNLRPDKLAWLGEALDVPPLARLARVMRHYDEACYARLLEAYEEVFAILADPLQRARLVESGPDGDARLTAALAPEYEVLRARSADISLALTRFALARRHDWGERFFERWLF